MIGDCLREIHDDRLYAAYSKNCATRADALSGAPPCSHMEVLGTVTDERYGHSVELEPLQRSIRFLIWRYVDVTGEAVTVEIARAQQELYTDINDTAMRLA